MPDTVIVCPPTVRRLCAVALGRYSCRDAGGQNLSPVPPRKRRGLLSWASLWFWRALMSGADASRGNAVATRARLAPGNGRTDL